MIWIAALLVLTHAVVLTCGIWIGAHHPTPVHADPRPHPETVAARPLPTAMRTAKCSRCEINFRIPEVISLPAIMQCPNCDRRVAIAEPGKQGKRRLPLPPPPEGTAA